MIYTAEDGKRYRVYNDKWQVFNVNKWEDLDNPEPIVFEDFTIPAYANHAAKMDEYERTLFIQHAQRVHLEFCRIAMEIPMSKVQREATVANSGGLAVDYTKALMQALKKEGILSNDQAPD